MRPLLRNLVFCDYAFSSSPIIKLVSDWERSGFHWQDIARVEKKVIQEEDEFERGAGRGLEEMGNNVTS